MRQSILVFLFSVPILTGSVGGQTFSDLVTRLGVSELASGYLRPAADAIGTSFNSGLYHTAKVEPAFHIYVGLKGVWARIPEKDQTFEAVLPSSLVALGYPSRVTTATAFGDSGTVIHSNLTDSNGNPYPDIEFPPGINIRTTFILLPHVTVGSLLASEFMIRVIPPMVLDPEIGKLRFYGFGIKHNPTQYIEFPVDISLMAAYQVFHVGDVLAVENYNANLHASVDLGLLTLYGGFGYEGYDIEARYNYTPPAEDLPAELAVPHNFTLDFTGRNTRFTVGLNLQLIPLLDLNVDYSVGRLDNITIGAGLAL